MPRSSTKADAQPASAPAKPKRERTAAQKAAAARNLKHGRQTTSSAAGDATEGVVHVVQPGDTLESIAAALGTSADAIFAANRDIIGSAPKVDVGMPLGIQVAAAVAAALEEGATPPQEGIS